MHNLVRRAGLTAEKRLVTLAAGLQVPATCIPSGLPAASRTRPRRRTRTRHGTDAGPDRLEEPRPDGCEFAAADHPLAGRRVCSRSTRPRRVARDTAPRDAGRGRDDLEGAVAFIRRQYTTIFVLAVVGAFVIGGVITRSKPPSLRRPKLAGVPIGIRRRSRSSSCAVLDGVGVIACTSRESQRPTASAARRSSSRRAGRQRGGPSPPSSSRCRSRCVGHLHPVRDRRAE